MAVRQIVKYPDPFLHKSGEKVTAFNADLHALLEDMAQTMYTAGGIGLAAQQVGSLLRVTVVDISEERNELREFINPEIIEQSGDTPSEEGCLSIPDYRDVVKRSQGIKVQAQDRRGKTFELAADGLLAICLQHEIDHLNGILFIDRLSRLKREMFRRWYKKRKESAEQK